MWQRVAAILLVFCCVAIASAKTRTWTKKDGQTIQGEFVRELDGEVVLISQGKLVTILLDDLNAADQQIAKDMAAGKEAPAPGGETPGDGPVIGAPGADAPVGAPPKGEEKKPVTPQNRMWTDILGRVLQQAKFVRINGDSVVLMQGGRIKTVPYFTLIESDQQYVREVLTSQGFAQFIPKLRPAENTVGGNQVGALPPAAPQGGGFADGGIFPPLSPPAGPAARPPGAFPPGASAPDSTPSGSRPGGVIPRSAFPPMALAPSEVSPVANPPIPAPSQALPPGMIPAGGGSYGSQGVSIPQPADNSSTPVSSMPFPSTEVPQTTYPGQHGFNAPVGGSLRCPGCRMSIDLAAARSGRCPRCQVRIGGIENRDGTIERFNDYDPERTGAVMVIVCGIILIVGTIAGVLAVIINVATSKQRESGTTSADD